jgi:hypothetical protein
MVVGPRSETEHAVAAMWLNLLGLPVTSIDEPFDEVGGDARSAARLLGQVTARWGVRLSQQEFQKASSIAGLSATIERKLADERTRQNDLLRDALAQLDALGDKALGFE